MHNKKWYALALIGIIVVGVLFFSIKGRNTAQFTAAYEAYTFAANRHADAAFLHGTTENPLRKEIYRLLAEALVGEVTVSERLAHASQGIQLLREAEGQIDAIGAAGESAEAALEALRLDSGSSLLNGGRRGEILALARERMEIIADIRGLSYRANHHTTAIFERIIADDGVLTEEHAATLNNQLPRVEEQFDHRSNLYDELERIGHQIDAVFAEL